jgi:hypothetical protein
MFCCGFDSFSQKVTDSLLCSFLHQTLYSFFEDSMIINEQNDFKNVLIEIDFDIDCLPKNIKDFKFEYLLSNKENELKKYLEPLKNGQSRMLYRLRYKPLSTDTIDVTISSSEIYKDKETGYKIAMLCGGTMGYIPQGRFIYDEKRDEWNFISGKTILDEKVQEVEEYYKKIIEDNRKRIEREKKQVRPVKTKEIN